MRYVDDIILICPAVSVHDTLERIRYEIMKLGLELNTNKTEIGEIGKDSFDFLGYQIKKCHEHSLECLISVRESSVDRLIMSLSSILVHANYHYKIEVDANRTALIEDLNERITGAFHERKKYGWLFYFSQTNDLALLYRLDRIVEKLCRRSKILGGSKPKEVKSFLVAFRKIHEMRIKNLITSDYIMDYDTFDFRKQLDFLNIRGVLSPDKTYNEDEINNLFIHVVTKRMSRLEKDIRGLS